MSKKILCCITFLLLLSGTSNLFAQTKDELQKKKDNLLKEISSLQEQLDKTSKNKNATLEQVTALKKKINARQSLINNYSSQINSLDKSISQTTTVIVSLKTDLKTLQDNYARMVYYAYKHRSAYDKLLFIFSAESFNDAFQRIKYLRRYSTYKKLQAEMIVSSAKELSDKKTNLVNQKKEKKQLLTEEETQKQKLSKEKAEQDKIAKNFSKQEKKLKTDIAAKKKEQEKLNKQIQDAIKKEIAAAAKNAGKPVGSTTSTSSSNLTLTPEAKELSSSFATNQGKFPWPVEKGDIIESFGTHEHPVLANVTTKNNGVDIKTSQGASVRCIFKGTVVSVLTNPVYHRAVLVRHGEYFTVYTNLESVNVKAGDVLTTKQTIGKAYTDSETGITMVHLEVWKGTVFMNPESWLLRK